MIVHGVTPILNVSDMDASFAWFAKRSRSTVPASRNLRGKRSLKTLPRQPLSGGATQHTSALPPSDPRHGGEIGLRGP